MAAFFQPVDLRCEPANLGIQVFQLLSVCGFEFGHIIVPLKDGWQTFQRLCAPVAQHIGMDSILRAELSKRFLFLEQLKCNLRFEGRSVSFFHREGYLSVAVSSV